MDKGKPTQQVRSQPTLSDAPSWIGTLSGVGSILSGVSSFGSFINSVVAAQTTAKFQQDLLNSLNSMQSSLSSIADDLGGIAETLKTIQVEIEGLGLPDKIGAIQSWALDFQALPSDMDDPKNLASAQNLASAMMNANDSASDLQGCMLGIHNAMVGGPTTSPLISQLPVTAFFQMRGLLVQGLHLLTFATAFNPKEDYDYGVFLKQWSDRFHSQIQAYFQSNIDLIVQMSAEQQEAGFIYNQTASDGIVQWETFQPNVPNVTLQVTTKDGSVLQVWNDTLTVVSRTPNNTMHSATATGSGYAIVDLDKNTVTPSKSGPLVDWFESHESPSEYYSENCWFDLSVLSNISYPVNKIVGNLVCGARFNPAQVFLGGCNGQTLWVDADHPLLAAIFLGTDLTKSMLTYDVSTRTVSTSTALDLQTLTGALWNVSMAGQNVIRVQTQLQNSVTLNLQYNPDGTWSLEDDPGVTMSITCPPAVPGDRGSPLDMAPTPVMMGDETSTSVVFYQF